SHARVHNHHVHGSGWKVRVSLRQRERTIEHVERLHGMANVHDLGFRNDVQDHALHGADKMVVESKVGSKRNDAAMRQRIPRLNRIFPEPETKLNQLRGQGTEVMAEVRSPE